jgi:hypothetical protein
MNLTALFLFPLGQDYVLDFKAMVQRNKVFVKPPGSSSFVCIPFSGIIRQGQ